MIKNDQQKYYQTLTGYFYAGQASVFGASSDSSNSPKAWLSDLIWIHFDIWNLWKVCFDSTPSFRGLGAVSRIGANLTVTTLESIHHDWFNIKKAAPKVCQTFEFNLNQPQSEINLIPRGPHHFPIFPQWLPPAAWSRRYDDNSATNQTRNWCHLDKSSTSAAAAVFQSSSQSNFQNGGENANLLGL